MASGPESFTSIPSRAPPGVERILLSPRNLEGFEKEEIVVGPARGADRRKEGDGYP